MTLNTTSVEFLSINSIINYIDEQKELFPTLHSKNAHKGLEKGNHTETNTLCLFTTI
jgi:hypothetical protein